jgi:hypothetical protein
MLKKILNLVPILAVLTLVTLPIKAWAYDWNDEGSPGTVQPLPGHPGLGLACDPDGDDCHTVRLPGASSYSQPYSYDSYSQPYSYEPDYGYGYNGYSGNSSLLYSRASAQAQYNAAVARGDRNGAQHLANALRKLDKQIGASNAQAGYGANTYNQGYYNPGYNNSYRSHNQYPSYNPYGANAGLNANGSATVLLPMLQQYFGF